MLDEAGLDGEGAETGHGRRPDRSPEGRVRHLAEERAFARSRPWFRACLHIRQPTWHVAPGVERSIMLAAGMAPSRSGVSTRRQLPLAERGEFLYSLNDYAVLLRKPLR